MSGDSQKLLELADECERAGGPDRSLDLAIICAAFPKVKLGGVPEYTSSLDAALTLVPEKAMWSVCDMEIGPYAQVIRPTGEGGYINGLTSASGEVPALALCAAALRARAAI